MKTIGNILLGLSIVAVSMLIGACIMLYVVVRVGNSLPEQAQQEVQQPVQQSVPRERAIIAHDVGIVSQAKEPVVYKVKSLSEQSITGGLYCKDRFAQGFMLTSWTINNVQQECYYNAMTDNARENYTKYGMQRGTMNVLYHVADRV